MSSIAGRRGVRTAVGGESAIARVKAYLFSDARRSIQTVLGLIWLLVGGLQFQSFMYGKGFIQMLTGMTAGQPGWVASSVNWGATTMQSDQAVFNSLAALIQVAIGFGILYRRTTKPAIVVSFVWALVVWWFGEAFGMLFMNMSMPLTGAPGAVLLYALIGAIVWPTDRPGGLLGVRGARTAWAALWLVMAWLWLLAPSSSANAIHNAINAAPSGMSWLSSVQDGFASITKGNGLVFALVLAAASAAIAIAVAANWRAKQFLILAAVLNLIFWVVGQGFGGIFAGGATDPNAGLLFIVLAYALYTLVGFEQRLATATRRDPTGQEVAVSA
ncbi:MAG: hypothetical protein ABSG43_20050 [Solirubrobacteraceae bacterium]|jgi:hypothetical protein